LNRLKELGVWLLDASAHAIYIGELRAVRQQRLANTIFFLEKVACLEMPDPTAETLEGGLGEAGTQGEATVVANHKSATTHSKAFWERTQLLRNRQRPPEVGENTLNAPENVQREQTSGRAESVFVVTNFAESAAESAAN
jgi:hypothetical protein